MPHGARDGIEGDVVKSLVAVAVFAILPGVALAQGLDASKPMRCAFAEAAECDLMAACTDVTLEQIELPDEVRVDFAAKQLTSSDNKRTSPIHALESFDEVLVLQGHENGRGWTMVVDRATGHMSASLASAEGAFVLAGGCTAE
jgi:hypothetical protein